MSSPCPREEIGPPQRGQRPAGGAVDRPRAPALRNRGRHDALVLGHDQLELGRLEVLDLAPRADPGLEQALDPDRVADPGDDLLVEERVADLAAGPEAPQALHRLLALEPGSQRVRPEPAQGRVVAQPGLADEPQDLPTVLRCDRPARGQSQPGLSVRKLAVGGDEPAAVHPQVAVKREPVRKVGDEVLAERLRPLQRRAAELAGAAVKR